jgi:hypothetical protein
LEIDVAAEKSAARQFLPGFAPITRHILPNGQILPVNKG